jgi:recombinational DNA repair protein RecR
MTFTNPLYYLLNSTISPLNITKFNIKIPKIYSRIKEIKINDIVVAVGDYLLH